MDAVSDAPIPNAARPRSASFAKAPPPLPDALARTGEYSIFGLTRAVDQSVAAVRVAPCEDSRRHVAGAAPNSRLNARLNAASDS